MRVNAFPTPFAVGDYAVTAIATFTSAATATELLDVSATGTALLYLNGALILDHQGEAGAYTASIAENLIAGSNTITAFYLDGGSVPSFSFDPSLPVAPAAPEAATLTMLLIGAAGLGLAARRRAKAVRA
jgi:hypothetical protein